MSQFRANLLACLSDGIVRIKVNLKSKKDVDIDFYNYISFLDSKGQRHFILFIQTEDASRIGVGGSYSKEINIEIDNELGLKVGDKIEFTLYNDNQNFKSNKKSLKGEEPKEAGNGGVVGVTSC